ncbi:MAG: hypothetical protein A2Z21_08230 [Candidatus Fraserbacteria bacterium RBG_16_55_9]|uniref:Uncharacterized protein n=1 Tax=Fraserbacteria sp. (strain RBG_16_55_9) TaxID=1817864 RepID=A0A1F5UNL8_FRAXR|nr:MAG: hypothetical protein A2Z21_08230 [Candidatus Fraserbacteria bacterium RBG_16_55_9]
MRRKVLLGLLLPTLIAVVGIGQADPAEQLKQLLLTESQVQEVLGQNWVIVNVDVATGLPADTVSQVGTYKNREVVEQVLDIGLLDFSDEHLSGQFLEAILAAKLVVGMVDIGKDKPEQLPEQLRPETKNVEKVVLVLLDNGLQQLMWKRQTLLTFFRTPLAGQSPLTLEQLIQVANRELTKLLEEFCPKADPKPLYCP